MGLDTSHDCFHGAYSAFSRWRDQLAVTAGYKMVKYEGDYREHVDLNWDAITQDNFDGIWDRFPADPLVILIAHSDCDGIIRWQDAEHLAKRLETLIDQLPPDDEAQGHLARYGWRGTTQRFIDGLRKAASNHEDVDFH